MKRLFLPFGLLLPLFFACDNQKNDKELILNEKSTPLNKIDNNLLKSMTLEDFETNLNCYTEKQFTLTPHKQINFKLPPNSDNFSLYPTYYEEGNKHYFINWNGEENAIELYDMENEKLFKKIVHNEHPKWELRHSYFINFDSIFVQINNRPGFFLMDSSGLLLKKWRVPDGLWYRYGANLYSNMTYSNSNFYMKYYPYNPSMKGNVGLLDSSTVLKIHTVKDSISFTGSTYPLAMTDSFYYHSQGGHTINGGYNNTISIRFSALPVIHSYDYIDDTTKVYYVRSKYQKGKIKYASVDDWGDPIEEIHHLRESYNSVIYDKYRHVYYSIFSHETPLINPKTGLKNDFDDIPISIIITDTNFNIMGETLLEPNKYFRNYLVTKEGLMISNANGKNPNNRLDVLSFTIFKLEEL